MKFQSLKNGPNFVCEKGTYLLANLVTYIYELLCKADANKRTTFQKNVDSFIRLVYLQCIILKVFLSVQCCGRITG